MSYINSNSLRSLNIFNDGFLYSLNSESSQCEQPSDIKMQLYGHQKAVLQCMKDKENELNQGKDISGSRLFSNFGILGDGVGVGKSLMILGHISNLKRFDTLRNAKMLTEYGNSNLYCIEEKDLYKDCSNAGCLIVVPHTLYKQWEKYIETQTKLSFYGVKTKAYLEKEKYEKGQLLTKDIVLVSNTLYGKLQAVMDQERVSWKRVFFDEADTLSILSTQAIPRTKFDWRISTT